MALSFGPVSFSVHGSALSERLVSYQSKLFDWPSMSFDTGTGQMALQIILAH